MEIISFIKIFNFLKPENKIFIWRDNDNSYLCYKRCKKVSFLCTQEWDYIDMIPYKNYKYQKKKADIDKTNIDDPFIIGYDKKDKEIFILRKPSTEQPIYERFEKELQNIQRELKNVTIDEIELNKEGRNLVITTSLKYLLDDGILASKIIKELSKYIEKDTDELSHIKKIFDTSKNLNLSEDYDSEEKIDINYDLIKKIFGNKHELNTIDIY
jgi:hypothetical protein